MTNARCCHPTRHTAIAVHRFEMAGCRSEFTRVRRAQTFKSDEVHGPQFSQYHDSVEALANLENLALDALETAQHLYQLADEQMVSALQHLHQGQEV